MVGLKHKNGKRCASCVVTLVAVAAAHGDTNPIGSSRPAPVSTGGTSHMVTGPTQAMRSAIASGAGMRFELRPMFTYDAGGVNGTYNNSGYYHEGNIVGNSLILPAGGGRAYFDLFMSGWGNACQGNPCNGYLRVWEVFVDAAGYSSGTGGALAPAVEPCANTSTCLAAFASGPGTFCSGGFCRFAWINKVRTDGIQRVAPPPPCSTNIWDVGNVTLSTGHNYLGVRDTYDPDSDTHCGMFDVGTAKYGGSFALDIPANADGTYTIGLVANTLISDDAFPEGLEIPIAELVPATVWFGQTATEEVANNQTTVVNAGGGSGDPEEDALVTFTNESGSSGTVTVTETDQPVHPGTGDFVLVGATLLVETTVADGQHFMTLVIPFSAEEIGYASPFESELLWFSEAGWSLAVSGNTVNSPGHSTREGDRHVALGSLTPDISQLSSDLGDYGVFWNEKTSKGFVWANVDHTSAFSAAGPPPPTIPAIGEVAAAVFGASLLGAGGWVIRRKSLAAERAARSQS